MWKTSIFLRIAAGLALVMFTRWVLSAADPAPAASPEPEAPLPFRGSLGEVRTVDAPAPVSEAPLDAPAPIDTITVETIGAEGIAAFDKGNFGGAREAYRRVLKIDPNNVPALVNLGSAEFRLGNLDEAERLLRRSLQLKADNPTAWLNLGILYLGREDPMRALAAIAQAVVHTPRDPVARNYLGVAAGRNRWFDAAEMELRRAIELKPDYADAHFNLAVFCLERTPPAIELARRHYQRALELGAEPDPLIEKALKN